MSRNKKIYIALPICVLVFALTFISIGDNELSQLKLLCDQIFTEENFIAIFVWVPPKSMKFSSF